MQLVLRWYSCCRLREVCQRSKHQENICNSLQGEIRAGVDRRRQIFQGSFRQTQRSQGRGGKLPDSGILRQGQYASFDMLQVPRIEPPQARAVAAMVKPFTPVLLCAGGDHKLVDIGFAEHKRADLEDE